MMLPILISVSAAPGSYFFWALAGELSKSATPATPASTVIGGLADGRCMSISLGFFCSATTRREVLLGGRCQACRPRRHDIDYQDYHHTVHRARQALGEALGEVRDEEHEGAAEKGARY